ncbi:hypothetical protein Dimus_001024 [Dionaea muscipula]
MVAAGVLTAAGQRVPLRHKAARPLSNVVVVTHGRGRQCPKPRAPPAALGFPHADSDDHGLRVMHRAWVECGGSRVRSGLQAKERSGPGHGPGRMPIGLLGTKASLVIVVLLLAAVHGGLMRWRLAMVAVLGDKFFSKP